MDHIMVFKLWLCETTKLTTTINTRQTLAISIAMQIGRCDAGCIALWMPPLGPCLCRIAPAATMINDFGQTHKH
jgi:hypothetical protein